jgi:hypothetical protein
MGRATTSPSLPRLGCSLSASCAPTKAAALRGTNLVQRGIGENAVEHAGVEATYTVSFNPPSSQNKRKLL